MEAAAQLDTGRLYVTLTNTQPIDTAFDLFSSETDFRYDNLVQRAF